MILENLAIYFQLFDVSISQWSVANNESELYRLVSICNKPVNYLFYIINPAIKNLRAQKPIHVLIRFSFKCYYLSCFALPAKLDHEWISFNHIIFSSFYLVLFCYENAIVFLLFHCKL